jgi:hypothetical protein
VDHHRSVDFAARSSSMSERRNTVMTMMPEATHTRSAVWDISLLSG